MTSDEENANVLQDFFSSVFTQEPPGDLPYFETRDFQYQLSDIDITFDMVKKKLLKLKSNKSPGPDSIHPRVLHDTAETIALLIMLIFRTSIKTKCLPHDWKVANISAIFKKGNKISESWLNYFASFISKMIKCTGYTTPILFKQS